MESLFSLPKQSRSNGRGSEFRSGDQDEDVPSELYKDFAPGDGDDDCSGAGLDFTCDAPAEPDSIDDLARRGAWLGSQRVADEAQQSRRSLPRAGDETMGFRLVRELGRGAFARVFLAEQLALANRRVAIKVSRSARDESQTLAQLQHTHIVPIYSMHAESSLGLKILVMPYFGGTTLERVLEKGGLRADPRATGHSLVTALDGLALDEPHAADFSVPGVPSRTGSFIGSASAASPWLPSRELGRKFLGAWRTPPVTQATIGQPARNVLERSNYIQAVTWIAARLAEALAHAHGRGILHRDIKPSNVLVASDGQPMLLDFNLARDTKSDDSGPAAYMGGTLPYMAPEHLDAFNPTNPTPPEAVDERSDIYSLGVVFFEMLTGRHPFRIETPGDSLPDLLNRMAANRRETVRLAHETNSAVPRSLSAVVARCLAPDPAARYQSAAELAEDLQRELDHLPLRHTREPISVERARKWMRRHPRLVSAGPIATISAGLLAVVFATVLIVGGTLAGYDAERRWLELQQGLVRAQCLVHTGSEPGQNLDEGQHVCEHALGLFGALDDANWRNRSRVVRLTESQQTKLPEQMTELLLLLARVRIEQAQVAKSARGGTALLEEARRLLDRAESISGDAAPRALFADRSLCRRQLGDSDGADADFERAEATPVRTARDHYLLATSLGVERRFAAAIEELDAALRIDPKHFWAHFELGICYDQLGRYAEAIERYSAAIALWPDLPWTYLNRGLASSRLGDWDKAVADYSTAIEHDPNFADAFINRGLAHLNQQRFADASTDLSRAIELGRRSATAFAARATARAALDEIDLARADFVAALESRPDDESIRLSRGFVLARHDAAAALADFDHVLARNSASARAFYGRALILSDQPDRLSDAIAAAESAVAADSMFIEARAALALLDARAGRFADALLLADSAIAAQPTGPILYTAACTYSLASRSDPSHATRAIELLRQALDLHYGMTQLESDSDLESIRSRPEFAELRNASR